MKTRLTTALAVGALGLTLTACGGDPTEGEKSATDTITIGSAAFPENEIIAEIYAQALEAKGIKVEKKLNIGAREAYIPALENGEIDLLPEYTGNLLMYLDKNATATVRGGRHRGTRRRAAREPRRSSSRAGPRTRTRSTSRRTSPRRKASRRSPTSRRSTGFELAANPEFKERPYGIPGLEKVYGITGVKFTAISDSGGPATLKALLDGKVDVANIYSTTPSIVANKLVTLEDPKNLIAAQNVVPLINDDKASDQVEDVLNGISAELTTEDLLDLNSRTRATTRSPRPSWRSSGSPTGA